MEQEFESNVPQEEQEIPEKEPYQPRPKWPPVDNTCWIFSLES